MRGRHGAAAALYVGVVAAMYHQPPASNQRSAIIRVMIVRCRHQVLPPVQLTDDVLQALSILNPARHAKPHWCPRCALGPPRDVGGQGRAGPRAQVAAAVRPASTHAAPAPYRHKVRPRDVDAGSIVGIVGVTGRTSQAAGVSARTLRPPNTTCANRHRRPPPQWPPHRAVRAVAYHCGRGPPSTRSHFMQKDCLRKRPSPAQTRGREARSRIGDCSGRGA